MCAVGNRRVIIRGDAFGCKTQFIVRVLSSALGGIRALTRKSESGKERELKRGVAFVENLTHAQIALKVLARARNLVLPSRGSVPDIKNFFRKTKFHYLVSQLEPKYVENIWDIVNSKSDTKYTDSKNRLLSLFKESENLRIKRLLIGIELGDMKPSQLLQKLKTVATSDISDNLIKTLWLEKLPESIKNILVVSDENLSKLAVMTDKISDMTPRTEIFATGKSLDCGEATSSRDQLLLNRIQSLEEQICQLSILHKSRTKERNSFHPKSRSRSRKRFDPKGKYCYFHFRFGARCKPEKCSPPCTWNRNTENFSLQ
ncbi:uncharacterized protein TNCV_2441241 [Trichonephila clavipes]|nr:uncharacterized protein TNCV_2441241 [Trichonephila clavipes]